MKITCRGVFNPMSLQVKIPAAEGLSQPSSSSSLHRRKSSSKRPLVYSDNDDDDDAVRIPVPQKAKRPRTADTDKSPSRAVSPVDQDMDVDIDTYRELSASTADDSRFLAEDTQSGVPIRDASPPAHSATHKGRASTTTKRRKSTSVSLSASTKKKSQVVYSDDEQSEVNIDIDSAEEDLDDALDGAEHSDDDPEFDTPPRRGVSKAKGGGASKSKTGMLKGAKGKGSKEKEKEKDKEILMKDERRLPPSLATTSRASSAAAQSQPPELFSNDEIPPPAADPSLADLSQPAKDATSQPPLKKRKLPTIKKTKTAGAPGTSTPTTTHKPPLPATQELPKPSVPVPASEQRKQALTGVRDVDLGDSKIYAELFKGTAGVTPRSGLKKDEERRKELDRMRDEARARRADEAKFMFDLQSQANKIARFEQRLRAENSTVLHPNFLAAKFRAEWELERRHRRRDERETSKEEGEV